MVCKQNFVKTVKCCINCRHLNKNIRDDWVTGNAHLTWEVIEDLSFRISFGIDLLNRREWIFRYEFYVYSTYQKLALKARRPGTLSF